MVDPPDRTASGLSFEMAGELFCLQFAKCFVLQLVFFWGGAHTFCLKQKKNVSQRGLMVILLPRVTAFFVVFHLRSLQDVSGVLDWKKLFERSVVFSMLFSHPEKEIKYAYSKCRGMGVFERPVEHGPCLRFNATRSRKRITKSLPLLETARKFVICDLL